MNAQTEPAGWANVVAEREENTHKRQIRLGRALSKGAATLTAVMLVVGGYLGYGQVRSIMDADSGAVMEGELTGFETASGPMDEPLPPPPEGVPASVQLVVFDAQGAEVGRVKGHRPAELDALLAKARR